MNTLNNEKQTLTRQAFVSPIRRRYPTILQNWIRISNIKLGWINDFDKLIVNYVMFFFRFVFWNNIRLWGSWDNIIRFWDIRLNKKELYVINGNKKDDGILCIKFLVGKEDNINKKTNNDCTVNLCYFSYSGPICKYISMNLFGKGLFFILNEFIVLSIIFKYTFFMSKNGKIQLITLNILCFLYFSCCFGIGDNF
ncbi:hypothetical protein RFI_17815 [Reticulomyxa filosa]|uniref:Uncharacterized protein n=1 Tax=Reticulomyxa filosa TaxID=46433 RepID=X6N0K6_RETFI|nr:hypothetical protein RFI_17815 [Reticulomyxa filosa]|eukprot:ETO19403.1 hypothetical protein RFI_17815 [Reticulomyxa filosa]